MDNPYINPSNQDGNDNLNNQQDSYYHTVNNADNTVSNDQAGYGDGFNKEMFGQPTNIGVTSFTQTTLVSRRMLISRPALVSLVRVGISNTMDL